MLAHVHRQIRKREARIEGRPVLPSDDQRVTPKLLAPPLQLEALQIDPGESETELPMGGHVAQVDIAGDRGREDDVVVDGQ